MRAAAAILILCAGAAGGAEQIRIEVARGKRSARVEAGGRMHALAAGGAGLTLDGKPVASAQFAGPLRLDGRELPGRLEVFSDRGALVAVNSVDLEQYVAAVVASEVPPGWPAEALRAQAVAARTFAVAQKIAQGPAARAHLGASILDQVYRNAARTPRPALEAARATAVELRQLLGYSRLPSLLFDVSPEGGVAVFRGRGSGHGVGLCQWGARARALAGGTYRDILAHYYPGAEIRRMY